jgi:hypothetical protein
MSKEKNSPEFASKQWQIDMVTSGCDYYALLQYSEIQRIEGQMLTIMDASFMDKEQREAVKSIVRSNIWLWARSLSVPNWNDEMNPFSQCSSK